MPGPTVDRLFCFEMLCKDNEYRYYLLVAYGARYKDNYPFSWSFIKHLLYQKTKWSLGDHQFLCNTYLLTPCKNVYIYKTIVVLYIFGLLVNLMYKVKLIGLVLNLTDKFKLT